MRRSTGWNVIRWAEFGALAADAAVALANALLGSGVEVPTGLLTLLALVSKALRATLRVVTDRPSSSVSPASWVVAAILALTTMIAAEVGPRDGIQREVVDAVVRDDAPTSDAGPGHGDPGDPGDPGTGSDSDGPLADPGDHLPGVAD